nr:hypothetical protein GCM10020092_034570 [Actinoplanes digitatis]
MTAKDAHAARRRPTSRDVAAAAGVSRSAVSFAFNDPTRVSTATRERILAAARELKYTPPPSGRTLRNGRTQSLGVLLPPRHPQGHGEPVLRPVPHGPGAGLHPRGHVATAHTPPLGDSLVKAVRHAAVDGFVVCGLDTDRGEIAELTRRALPYVLVDSDAPEGAPSVDIDDRDGARDVTQHLLELGHRRIAVLSVEPRSDRLSADLPRPAGTPDSRHRGRAGRRRPELSATSRSPRCPAPGWTATARPRPSWPPVRGRPRSSCWPT